MVKGLSFTGLLQLGQASSVPSADSGISDQTQQKGQPSPTARLRLWPPSQFWKQPPQVHRVRGVRLDL